MTWWQCRDVPWKQRRRCNEEATESTHWFNNGARTSFNVTRRRRSNKIDTKRKKLQPNDDVQTEQRRGDGAIKQQRQWSVWQHNNGPAEATQRELRPGDGAQTEQRRGDGAAKQRRRWSMWCHVDAPAEATQRELRPDAESKNLRTDDEQQRGDEAATQQQQLHIRNKTDSQRRMHCDGRLAYANKCTAEQLTSTKFGAKSLEGLIRKFIQNGKRSNVLCAVLSSTEVSSKLLEARSIWRKAEGLVCWLVLIEKNEQPKWLTRQTFDIKSRGRTSDHVFWKIMTAIKTTTAHAGDSTRDPCYLWEILKALETLTACDGISSRHLGCLPNIKPLHSDDIKCQESSSLPTNESEQKLWS